MGRFVRATLRGVEVGFRGPGQALPDGAAAAPDRDALVDAFREVTRRPGWVDRNALALQALARPALTSADLPYGPGCASTALEVDGVEVIVWRYAPFLH